MRERLRETKLANRILAQAWSRRLISRIIFWSFVLWVLPRDGPRLACREGRILETPPGSGLVQDFERGATVLRAYLFAVDLKLSRKRGVDRDQLLREVEIVAGLFLVVSPSVTCNGPPDRGAPHAARPRRRGDRVNRRPGLMLIIASVVVGVITPVPTIPTVESETTSESTTAETSEAPAESAETTKSTAAEAAKPAAAEAAKPTAAEAAKPTAPETSSADPP
jgi:hypothetical protein